MSHSSFMPRADYAVTQKVLHWLMALLIMLDLIIAQKFGGEMADWDRFASRSRPCLGRHHHCRIIGFAPVFPLALWRTGLARHHARLTKTIGARHALGALWAYQPVDCQRRGHCQCRQ